MDSKNNYKGLYAKNKYDELLSTIKELRRKYDLLKERYEKQNEELIRYKIKYGGLVDDNKRSKQRNRKN